MLAPVLVNVARYCTNLSLDPSRCVLVGASEAAVGSVKYVSAVPSGPIHVADDMPPEVAAVLIWNKTFVPEGMVSLQPISPTILVASTAS